MGHGEILTIELPQPVVLTAQTPQAKSGHAIFAAIAHGVEVGGGIVEIDLMGNIILIVVGEVETECA